MKNKKIIEKVKKDYWEKIDVNCYSDENWEKQVNWLLEKALQERDNNIKSFVEEFNNKSHTTHSCPEDDENYECSCVNPKIEDQNCFVIPKVIFYELLKKHNLIQNEK